MPMPGSLVGRRSIRPVASGGGGGGGSATVFNPSAASGRIASNNATYATARSGGTLTATAGDTLWVGQATGYEVYESFLDFNLADIVSGVTGATLSFARHADAWLGEHLTVEARTRDWGASLETTDYVPGADLGALPLLASASTTGMSQDVYSDLTSNGNALRDAVIAAGTGILRIILCSDRTRLNTTPTTGEIMVFHPYNHATLKPKLVVTTT